MSRLYTQCVYPLTAGGDSARVGLELLVKEKLMRPALILTSGGEEIKIVLDRWLIFKVHLLQFKNYCNGTFLYASNVDLSNEEYDIIMLTEHRFDGTLKFSVKAKDQQETKIVSFNEEAVRHLHRIRYLIEHYFDKTEYHKRQINLLVHGLLTMKENIDDEKHRMDLTAIAILDPQFDTHLLVGEIDVFAL
jgi:hypothetical protein